MAAQDTSVLFSLNQIMNAHESRLREEQEAVVHRAEAERKAREEAQRREAEEMAARAREEAAQKASEVLGQVDLAQAYAQEAETDYDDYAQRAAAAGAEPGAEARIAYEAGFDIGFSAALVHGCEALTGQGPRTSLPEDAGAQGLEDVASRL